MARSVAALTFVVVLVTGCQGAAPVSSGAPASTAPAASQPAAAASPDSVASAPPTASVTQAKVPAGRILFQRHGPGEVEHYFTIDTDGSDEKALYSREGCGCAHWSADGSRVQTVDATGLGTWSLATMKPDGSELVVVPPPIKTLSLFVGASSSDGRKISFWGMDETDPSKTGLYLASPDLADLRLVTPLQEGWTAIETFGVTPDGSKIVFFAETGPDGGITHAGDLYVIDADGSGLRQLNPQGNKVAWLGMPNISMSPDGRQAAFTVDDDVWVVDLAGGEAKRITKGTGFVWAVSWSPTGDWITYTRFHGDTSVVALVRPDGTEDHEISTPDETDEANAAVWSPDGKYLLVRRDSDATVDGPGDLWIMDMDGAYVGQVTHEPSDYATYSWAPN